MTAAIMQAVRVSGRHPWLVVLGFIAVTLLGGLYVARNFAIDTDSDKLLSASLPWRQQEIALDRAFPQRTGQLIAVIDASTPEKAEAAADALIAALSPHTDLIRSIRRPDGGPFFAKNGALFLDLERVRHDMAELKGAEPLLAPLAADPSLRGILGTLSQGLQGVSFGMAKLSDLEPSMTAVADALERLSQGKDAAFSWRRLIGGGQPPSKAELRRFVNIQPVLDFDDLEPGGKATRVIRDTIGKLNLTPAHGVTVRLTGPIALSDEEFATVAEGAEFNTAATIVIVVLLLWLALRQWGIIAAVVLNLTVGLVLTAAAGLWLVGALNLISVAFAVLFIGIGVDFGIQFGVRYRAERHKESDLHLALLSTARIVAGPLLLAAASIAAAFYSFLPTAYRGLSELGLIAGTGMIIAFATTVTLLPALIVLFRPAGEPEEVGYPALAPVDRFLNRRGNWVVGVTLGLTVLALPLLWQLRFDSNPLDLRSKSTEAVSTLLDLLRDPQTSPNTIDILTDNLKDAAALAERLRKLPEVARVVTLDSFVPEQQDEKLAAIGEARSALQGMLDPSAAKPPTAQATEAALADTARELNDVAGQAAEPAAAQARRLAGLLEALAKGPPAAQAAAEQALVAPLTVTLAQLRNLLSAARVDLASLPPSLKSDWVTADGKARVEVAPSGDGNDEATLRHFADAVRAVAPNATGMPVLVTEAAATIVKAFIQAGVFSVVSIALILYVTLRRWLDVALTLVPLLVALVVTLEICAAIDLQLNFANIIALPLLLGVGVAFKIYYVMAWRAGETNFLQSSLTRAVFFSACTTATAFGSLWLSHHPGTSSMGKLMALALLTTMAAATLFQPALLASQNGARSEARDETPSPEGPRP